MKARVCPFCGKQPDVYPKRPEIEGNAFGQVRCENWRCPANPVVNDGALSCDERGPEAYRQAAIRRWNRRFPAASPTIANQDRLADQIPNPETEERG